MSPRTNPAVADGPQIYSFVMSVGSGSELVADSEKLIDYLTIMVWSSIAGITAAGDSAEHFNSRDHPLPKAPGAME